MATEPAYWSALGRQFRVPRTITTVAVLVGTHDGYHVFTSSGGRDQALVGHHVDAFTPGPGGTWIAIVDGNAVWQHGADGQWAELARSDLQLVSLTCAHDTMFAGTADARVLRADGDKLVPLPSFDHAPGRDDWHQVGPPIEVRSLTSTCDGKVVLANVHVGGVLRSTDGGESWEPTMNVDNDVHEVLAHPDRPEVVLAAAAIGLLRSHDAGATWTAETDGLTSTYSRGIAALDDTLYLSNATGPFANESCLFSAPLTEGALTPVTNGLPAAVPGMIDTRMLAARNGTVAVGSRTGHVWSRPRGQETWTQLEDNLPGLTCIAVI
jgi:hypothetical protein